MKVKNGVPFTVETERCIAQVTVENFTPEIVEKFNQGLVDAAIRKVEAEGLKIA